MCSSMGRLPDRVSGAPLRKSFSRRVSAAASSGRYSIMAMGAASLRPAIIRVSGTAARAANSAR